MRLTKIPISQEMPNIVRYQAQKRRLYKNTVQISANFRVVFRETPYCSVSASQQEVLKSELFAFLLDEDQCIGALFVDRYDPRRWQGNDSFWQVMDASSGDEAALASTLCIAWEDIAEEVTWFGPILYFNSAWIDKRYAAQGLLRLAVRLITQTVWPNYSLAVTRAFPLESSSDVTSDPRVVLANSGRQRAMVRHYASLFEAHPFPGYSGQRGWLWSLNPKAKLDIRPPKERVDWRAPLGSLEMEPTE